MIISFFEEFPTKENLAKTKMISWKSKIYLASHSLQQFLALRRQIKNAQEIIYWPILEKKEGYWISPFSKREAVHRILREEGIKKSPVMLDLELPTTRNPSLFLTESCSFFRNKKAISDFLNNHKDVYLAEYYHHGKFQEKALQMLGLHYQNSSAKIIKMLYSSMHHFEESFIRKEIKAGRQALNGRFILGLGAIAKGILGTEPILSPEGLRRDLQLAKEEGIKEVVIFRLGGLSNEYAKVIKQFCR